MVGKFSPHTNVADMAVIVVGRDNKRYGQLGALEAHDWKESGVYFVRFTGAEHDEPFPDGLEPNQPASPVDTFYRHRDETGRAFDWKKSGPMSLIESYLDNNTNKSLKDFAEEYKALFNEPFK